MHARCLVGRVVRAIAVDRLLARHFMLKMRLSPRFMGVSSYGFCSGLGRLQPRSRHAGGHGITHPAA